MIIKLGSNRFINLDHVIDIKVGKGKDGNVEFLLFNLDAGHMEGSPTHFDVRGDNIQRLYDLLTENSVIQADNVSVVLSLGI